MTTLRLGSLAARTRFSFVLMLALSLAGWTFADDAQPPTTQPASGKLTLTTWATTGFLKNPTALTFDRSGHCYVAQTMRREGGELESERDLSARLLLDLTFTSIEDKYRWAGDGDSSWATRQGGKKEIITRLEDSHHTGHADKAQTFYEGFDVNGNDILAGILWNDGNIYATLAPNLWLLRDSNNTGHADSVQSLSYGYAVHMGEKGHNMHGLTMGPDGKLYFTIGDKGLNVTTREGRHLVFPWCGCCLRCNPDGSDLEVFAYGLRNTFEVAFDNYGNMFGVDNDGDFPGERERLVYITQDSDSGWRFNWQWRSKAFDVDDPPEKRHERYNPWLDEKLWVPHFPGQAAYITPPLANYTDGPCGFKYATEGSLDAQYAGAFFVDEFPKATIRSFRVKPNGASFLMEDDQVVSRGVQCTGLTLAPDGAIYAAEWGKTAFKLGNTGSVMKLDDPSAAESSLRVETRTLLKEGPAARTNEELLRLLGHADMRVRLDAQFELVKRNQQRALFDIAFSRSRKQMARIHALWGLGQFVSAHKIDSAATDRLLDDLAKNLDDSDAEIRAQSLKLIGEIAAKYSSPSRIVEPVIAHLSDTSPRVRFFAGMAVGKLKDHRAFEPLLHLASQNQPVDAFLRHAIVMGLAGIGDVDGLARTINNPSVEVRLTAVVALRRLRSPAVAAFLNNKDEQVATEAARAIHDDDSILAALPQLAAAADRTGITSEAFIRRALNADLRLGGQEQIDRLVRYAANEQNPSAMRVEALDILASWESPAVTDRVEGRYRIWPGRSGFAVNTALGNEVAELLSSSDQAVAQATTRAIEALGIKTEEKVFAEWVADQARPAGARVAALDLLARHKNADLTVSLDKALASDQPLLRIEAMRIIAEQDPPRAMKLITQLLDTGTTIEKQSAFRLLGTLRTPDAIPELDHWLDQLVADKLPQELQLDLIEATEQSHNPTLRRKIKQWQAAQASKDPLAIYDPELSGGDAQRGLGVFTSHADVACVRCHSNRADGSGSSVGPNLAGIGAKPDKPPRYLLQSLIDPNAYIVPGFGTASFTLKDGTTIAATVKSEDAATVQLLDLEGHASTLRKADIASRTPAVSMMPAMGAILSRDEIRDVVAYLRSLR